MAMHGRQVAVVGGGIGGSAAAIFLARMGWRVTIFERADYLGSTGAGILLSPAGQYVLDRLGLLDAAVERGSKVQRIEGFAVSGRRILDLRYRNLATGLYGLGIHRGTLFQLLVEALRAEEVEIQTGWQVESAAHGMIRDRQGRTAPGFDLVVAADGARSSLRSSFGVQTRNDPYPYGALWISLPNWGVIPDNVLRQVYAGTRRMAGLLPSGRREGEEGRMISLFWSLPMAAVEDWRGRGLEAWRREVIELLPDAEEVMSEVQFLEQATVAPYFDVQVWSTVKENCALIGDAAHASSPQLGMGASLALIDAWILSDCLAREPNIMAALLEYREMRRRQTRLYQLASKWMTPFFQSGASPLAWSRDLLLGPLCRWPFFQREALAVMSGIQDGPLRRVSWADAVFALSVKRTFMGLERPSADLVPFERAR